MAMSRCAAGFHAVPASVTFVAQNLRAPPSKMRNVMPHGLTIDVV